MHPLWFPKDLLYIYAFNHNKQPVYRAQVSSLLHFLCLTNHIEKSCTSVPIPSQKDGVKQGGIENLKKKKKEMLAAC